jgi:hypothetical protein
MHVHLSELPIQNLCLPIPFRLLFITCDRQNDVIPYEKRCPVKTKPFVVLEFGGKESVFICDILCIWMRSIQVIAYFCFLKDFVSSRFSVKQRVETDSLWNRKAVSICRFRGFCTYNFNYLVRKLI